LSKLTDKLFGTHSSHEIARIKKTVAQIEKLRDDMQRLSDEELKHKTVEFKERLENGETLDSILVEAFAAVREGARRTKGMEPFPVQMMGGILMHQGRVAEMKTGEGKTLVAVLPAYLNALEGKGVHVVTVNDYLAERDSEIMRPIYEFMGLTVGFVSQKSSNAERKAAYSCDITYVTNNELGFDYLRDNIAESAEQQVLRGLNYAIIDECDSVLIDEARTPLIISGPGQNNKELIKLTDIFVRTLEAGEDIKETTKRDFLIEDIPDESGDYMVNRKDKYVLLTAQGIEKAEKFFGINNYSDVENLELQHDIDVSLRAHALMQKDHDYIVRNDEILIVDDFTGRVLPGRRYSDGLHQAIEAKERVTLQDETITMASITFQSFFNKFTKKCGMTGTAITEEQEFRDIYYMDVVSVPTNRPVQRIDEEDVVYRTKKEKFNAVMEAVEDAHARQQPVLIGTVDIETNEYLSRMLTKRGIQHQVLNAKYDEQEAEIVAQAGIHGTVTIATNMAGRGTDIKLDDISKKAGGLFVIGTQRHESRRIDNQLRGRSGRQGDPGRSRFYLSLEDDLLKLFGGASLNKAFNIAQIQEGEPIYNSMVTKAIEKAQRNIEVAHCESRKNILDYDEVMNIQREEIYAERNALLHNEGVHELALRMIRNCGEEIAAECKDEAGDPDAAEICSRLERQFPGLQTGELNDFTKDGVGRFMMEMYRRKLEEIDSPVFMNNLERYLVLHAIDSNWRMQMEDMDLLKDRIHNVAYAQRDPKIEYKLQAFELYKDMAKRIYNAVTKALFMLRVEYEDVKEDTVIRMNAEEPSSKVTTSFTIGRRPVPVFDDISEEPEPALSI